MITLWHYLAVAAALFGIGLVGFLTRRNLITMFLCAEMMLQAVAINLVAFARFHGNLQGQVFVLFIVAVAACEAAIALALVLMLYRRGKTLDSSGWIQLSLSSIMDAPNWERLLKKPVPNSDTNSPTPISSSPKARQITKLFAIVRKTYSSS